MTRYKPPSMPSLRQRVRSAIEIENARRRKTPSIARSATSLGLRGPGFGVVASGPGLSWISIEWSTSRSGHIHRPQSRSFARRCSRPFGSGRYLRE